MTTSVFSFGCPNCGQSIEAPTWKSGVNIHCPTCQYEFRTPRLDDDTPIKTEVSPPVIPATPPPPPETFLSQRSQQLKTNAETLFGCGWASAIFALMLGIAFALDPSGPVAYASGAFWSLALALFLFGHLTALRSHTLLIVDALQKKS